MAVAAVASSSVSAVHDAGNFPSVGIGIAKLGMTSEAKFPAGIDDQSRIISWVSCRRPMTVFALDRRMRGSAVQPDIFFMTLDA